MKISIKCQIQQQEAEIQNKIEKVNSFNERMNKIQNAVKVKE